MDTPSRTCFAVFERVGLGIVLVSPQGVVLATNPGFDRVFGYPAEALTGRPLPDVVHPDHHATLHTLLTAASTDCRYLNLRLLHRDGNSCGCRVGVTWAGEGAASHAIFLVQPLDETLQMRRALDHSSCSVIILDTHERVEYVNPKFTEITGYSPEEVVGRRLDLLKGETWSTDFAGKNRAMQEGREWRGEFRNRRKDGSLYYETAVISPVFNERNDITHYISINEDVTDRKAVEDLLGRTMSESIELSKQLELTNALMREQKAQLEKANLKLGELAKTDGLTGLLNHRSIMEQLKRRLQSCRRSGGTLAVLMLDLDNFKRVNDTYGHQTGDEVLAAVAAVVNSTIRDTDAAGRYGGEEFLVVFGGANLEQARAAAERIRERVSRLTFKEGFPVSTSGGLAAFQGQSQAALLEQADQRLYQAKRAGKNRIVGEDAEPAEALTPA